MGDYASLRCTVEKGVATITLNRPEVLNAITPALMDELKDALERAPARGARAALLTGAGRAFCAGADLSGRSVSDENAGARAERNLIEHYNPVIRTLAELEIPVVTAVNGAAAGIGCSIALSGDLIVAGRSAYFLQAFVNIGFVPDGGATWTLPRVIGLPNALKMMMLGERVHAPAAEAMGLISHCVEDDEVMPRALELAAKLAAGPTIALGMMRRMARESFTMSLDEAMTREAAAQKRALGTRDAAEGVQAFVEKRPPAFRGE